MARKLKIEYAKAVIDWAFKKKRMYAVRKGIVVHDKDAGRLISAWKENLLDRLRKVENKVKQRVYGNWSRLARNSLLVKKVREKVGLLRKKPIEKNQETLSDSDEEKEEQEEGIEQEQWPAAEFPLQDLHKR
ncbi:hypothetical protein L596_010739 [Steinernema carpocapsae]|uniref:Rad4 beta-hairpin domain-containing protein n=2 Tax=Steinernema carpocapsae TaxID=34508 RepID=A0A4V6XWN8_STECR|nr:hypothetical protein L596_010739 [Steinernema carpocapsae]